MRRILLRLAILLLLSSCVESTSLALFSESGATVYRFSGSRCIMIRVSYTDLHEIELLSGEDGLFALSSLMDIPAGTITVIGSSEFFDRRNLLVLLASETHTPSPEMALWKNAEDLENTAFLDTINRLSSSFDESLIAAFSSFRGDYREYRLGDILSSPDSWDDACDFFSRWMNKALKVEL